jgi:hypothetical protein
MPLAFQEDIWPDKNFVCVNAFQARTLLRVGNALTFPS